MLTWDTGGKKGKDGLTGMCVSFKLTSSRFFWLALTVKLTQLEASQLREEVFTEDLPRSDWPVVGGPNSLLGSIVLRQGDLGFVRQLAKVWASAVPPCPDSGFCLSS